MPFSRPVGTHPTVLAALAAVFLTACGGGSSLLLPGDGVANHIRMAAGNNQSGRVGEPLSDPLVAEVTDSRGRPVQGVSVAFAFTSSAPGAEINPSTATTDAKGEAVAQVVLGTRIGAQTGEATIVTDGPDAPSTTFTLMAVSENANGIAVFSGDDQTGKVSAKLRQPLVVQVTDAFGNPIPGVPIDWTAQGGGSVSEASNTSDENGLASVERTLGPATGKQTTQASSPGLAGSPVTFTHTATAGSASSLTIVSGNNQTAKVGSKLPADLVVQLLDGDGNGVPSTAVTWVVGTGGGSVTPENGTTDDQGVATAQWTLGPNPGENRVDAVVSGVGVANFRASGTSGVPPTETTTTTITGDSPDPSVSGSPFTVDVRVTSSGAVPSGSVRVTADGAAANCTVTLQNGSGSCSLTLQRTGDRTLRATYSGAPGFKSSSASAPHRVEPPAQQNRQPHADYNWTCNGLTCQFTDHSSDPDGDGTLASWSWTFGDGGSSQLRNPAHTFPAAGRYEVALTVGDNAGGSNTATAHPEVQGPPPPPPPPANKAPHAEFDVQCTNQSCSFTDRSRDEDGSIAHWQWDFGDGQGSGDPNPTHSFAAPGTYHVTLTVTDNGGATDFKTHDANPSAPPPANTTTSITSDDPDPSVQGVPFTVAFTVSSGSGVPAGTVTVSDGTDSCSGNLDGIGSGSCSLTPTTTGAKTLTATYPGNPSFAGSQGTAPHTVDAPPPANTTTSVSVQGPNPSTQNQPVDVTFSVTSAAGTPTGSVTVADGSDTCTGTLDGSGSGSCLVALSNVGTRTITATYPGNSSFAASSGTTTHDVEAANQAPTAVIGSISCTGLSCTYIDASTDPNGDQTIVQWSWVFGDDASSDLQNPTHDYATAGNYDVILTVTDNGGLTGTAQETIPVGQSGQTAVVRTRAHT